MRYKMVIEGMGCEHCINAVKSALEELPNTSATVELGSAAIETDQSKEALCAAVSDAGYDVVSID